MTACNDEIGRRTTTQQPTNERQGRAAAAAVVAARQHDGGGNGAQHNGGSAVAATRRQWRIIFGKQWDPLNRQGGNEGCPPLFRLLGCRLIDVEIKLS
jgi:hypothetical protein